MTVDVESASLWGDEVGDTEEAEAIEEAQLFNLLHKSDKDRLVKRTEKEETLQAAARSLIFEYGFDLAELERAFPIKLTTVSQATGKVKTRVARLDLAAFANGTPHKQYNIVRAGVIVPSSTRPDDEKRGITALDDILGALPLCEFGFWTNGQELAFRRKVMEGTMPCYYDISDMPAAGETIESLVNQKGRRRLVAQTPETLAQTFRRCHDYIHGNQGLNKSQAFWEFLRLIFCKMYDEQRETMGRERRFWVGLTERFTPEGQKAIKERLSILFEEVKGKGSVPSEYTHYFRPDETIGLHEPVLAYVAGELSRYEMLSSSEDTKGAAYEELIDRKQKADRGQFFTPRNIIKLMVEMLDPDEADYILDPACGTGGFLVMVLRHVRKKIETRLRASWINPEQPTTAEADALRYAVQSWAAEHIYGFDFDPDLVKATQMNLALNGGDGRVYCIDSLKFPFGHTADLARFLREQEEKRRTATAVVIGDFNTFTLCFTNPPFGSKIPFTDRVSLLEYELARVQLPESKVNSIEKSKVAYKRSVPPEVLFIERCVKWVCPGGRVGIVLPDGILGNPKDIHIRRWILDTCDVLASVDLPVETFLPQVGVQPSLLFMRKKTTAELDAEAMGKRSERMVFMAIVDRVGKDRRGNIIYKKKPDGTDAAPIIEVEPRTAFRDGHEITVEIPIEKPVIDDELPEILVAWRQFQQGQER